VARDAGTDDLVARGLLHGHLVGELERGEDRTQRMQAVGPAGPDLEDEVDLGRS
jgi:hypothetical protein